MRTFKADLHIHSCLSPCADLDMSPRSIVERSVEKGLDIIAICDHNYAENTEAAIRASEEYDLRVLPGLEINSSEEVHVLAIFEEAQKALHMQEIVYCYLTGSNRPDLFGDQVVADEFDEVKDFNERMLISATQLGIHEIVERVHRLGGLCIASHVDRPSYSIISHLGFVPSDLQLDALEISRLTERESAQSKIQGINNFPIMTFSDAHCLDDIGLTYTSFLLELPIIDDIRMALTEEFGRRVMFN